MIDPSDVVVVLNGPHTEIVREAERLTVHGLETLVVAPAKIGGS